MNGSAIVALMRESAVVDRTAYSPAEVAEQLEVSERQVWRLLQDKVVPSFPIGTQRRIRAEDVPTLAEHLAKQTDEQLITVEELAQQWGVGERTIWRLISRGDLPFEMKNGKRQIAPELVREYVDRQIELANAASVAA